MSLEFWIAEQVKFIGLRFVLPEIYRLFDVFLLKSFSGNVAWIHGQRSAIGCDGCRGNGEVVVEGETGFLVPVDGD